MFASVARGIAANCRAAPTVGAEAPLLGGQTRQGGRHEHAAAEHEQQEQAAQAQ